MRLQSIFYVLFVFLTACSAAGAAVTPTASATFQVQPSATVRIRPTPSQTRVRPTLAPTSDIPTPKSPAGRPGIKINPMFKLYDNKAEVYAAVWSPDGATYTIRDSLGLSIFDAKTKEKQHFIPHLTIGSVYYSPNSRILAYIGNVPCLIDVRTGEILVEFDDSFMFGAFSPDSKQYAYVVPSYWASAESNGFHIFDMATQKEIFTFTPEQLDSEFSFAQILFDSTGTRLLAMTNQHAIYVFNAATGALEFNLSGDVKAFGLNIGYSAVDALGNFVFSNNGKYLASYAYDRDGFNILVWNWATKEAYPAISAKWEEIDPSFLARRIHHVAFSFSTNGAQLDVMLNTHVTIRYNIASGGMAPAKNGATLRMPFYTNFVWMALTRHTSVTWLSAPTGKLWHLAAIQACAVVGFANRKNPRDAGYDRRPNSLQSSRRPPSGAQQNRGAARSNFHLGYRKQ